MRFHHAGVWIVIDRDQQIRDACPDVRWAIERRGEPKMAAAIAVDDEARLVTFTPEALHFPKQVTVTIGIPDQMRGDESWNAETEAGGHPPKRSKLGAIRRSNDDGFRSSILSAVSRVVSRGCLGPRYLDLSGNRDWKCSVGEIERAEAGHGRV